MFERRRFPVEIILVCVRWYCKLAPVGNANMLLSCVGANSIGAIPLYGEFDSNMNPVHFHRRVHN